ncbi:MAG: terminase small subunit [Pseudomonadota bacterium]
MAKKTKRPAEQKWERFAREYMIDHNATRAYKAAGYQPKNDRVAEACASRLLSSDKVQALIAEFSREVAEKLELKTEDVLREAMRIAFCDPRRLFDERGRLLHPTRWPDEIAAAVASVEVVEESAGRGGERELVCYSKKVKLWDKNSALEKLFKHLGLFEKDNAQKTDPMKALLEFVQERGRGLPVRG